MAGGREGSDLNWRRNPSSVFTILMWTLAESFLTAHEVRTVSICVCVCHPTACLFRDTPTLQGPWLRTFIIILPRSQWKGPQWLGPKKGSLVGSSVRRHPHILLAQLLNLQISVCSTIVLCSEITLASWFLLLGSCYTNLSSPQQS